MRILLALLLLTPAASLASDADPGSFAGRPVVEVIDEFRAAGVPFAYSTNLVRADLTVVAEPQPGNPVDIVRQVLRPHGLTIEERAGVYLVTRFDAEGLEGGSILLVITSKESSQPVVQATVAVEPELGGSTEIKPGVLEYSEVAPGRYVFTIEANGFDPALRIIDVWPGETKVVTIDLSGSTPVIETISVSASRYEILREVGASRFVLDSRTVQSMPDFGEDPMRAVHRLPGAAASGASARAHFRGGDEDEVGIMLNGQWLFDPFHIRDYQSIFSAIDSRAIEVVEVFTGGFPVRFGNRMSGLVLIESLEAMEPRHTEIGLSVYNTSFLNSGSEADRRWLVSARRGNLDLVIKPEFGQPSYYDLFTEFAYDFSPDTTLSINALYADDGVEIITESEPAELERLVSKTRNIQLWLQLDNTWSDNLSSQTVVSAVSFDNRRAGSLGDEEKIVASVLDEREATQIEFRQDFAFNKANRHLVRWGLNVEYSDAQYDYRNSAEYFGLQSWFEDQPESVSRALSASPSGASYAAYFSDRWQVSDSSIVEWGLRWDDQTYTDQASDSQLSPRLAFMTALGPKTELRMSWGRYHQPQQIHRLQIEDGITDFWPAQRADHIIAGVSHLFGSDVSVRVELFQKNMQQVRPRFENLFGPLGLIPEVLPDRVRLDPTSARSRGLEVSVDRVNGQLTWWGTYAYSKATDRIGDRHELRSWDQRHAFQGGISWSSAKWDVALVANVHTGWPLTELSLIEDGIDDEGEIEYVAIPGPRNAGRYPTFGSLDFRLSRTWKLRRGSLMAFLEISNLTNRDNECCLDWDFEEDEQTGEEVFERGVDYWMPLLPAIGVLWEF